MRFPIGTEVHVTGTMQHADGRPNPYGIVGTVTGVHQPTGRLVVETWRGRHVVRTDETVTEV